MRSKLSIGSQLPPRLSAIAKESALTETRNVLGLRKSSATGDFALLFPAVHGVNLLQGVAIEFEPGAILRIHVVSDYG